MHPFSLLLALFIAIPIVEMYVLIKVGGVIGAFPTIFLVVFTAFLGAWLIRIQGISTLMRIRQSLNVGEIPALEMMEGVCLFIAGALLLTPGFVTDSVGFLCLVPAFRRALILALTRRWQVTMVANTRSSARGAHQGKIIEGEFNRED